LTQNYYVGKGCSVMLDGISDYSRIKDRKSPIKGSRPSVPHGTNFFIFYLAYVASVSLFAYSH